jgi:hypothetical protein
VFEQEPEVEWTQLREHPDYDIQSEYPFLIRKRANGRIMTLSPSSDGYLRVYIDGQYNKHHKVVAEEFIDNPDNLPEIDHLNHVRDDNHLENLRWVSRSTNCKNRTAFNSVRAEYVDELPDGAEPLPEIRGKPLAQGHYSNGRDYYVEIATGRYRRMHHSHRNNSWRVGVRGADGKRIEICWHD